MDNLIYDRTEEDVEYALANPNSESFLKGAYNYTDFNRIEDWNIAIANRLNGYGYPVNIATHENQNNILKNGSLGNGVNGWTTSTHNVLKQNAGYTTLRADTISASGTYPCYQSFQRISGNTEGTKKIIYAKAKVRGRTSNVSYPRVYLSYYANGSTTVSYQNLTSIDGASGTDLNDGEWHTLSGRFATYNSTSQSYFDFTRIAFGISNATINDEMDIKDVAIINLTEVFEKGQEPTKIWCDANLSGTWNMNEFPTKQEMRRIRNNALNLKEAYYAYTDVPDNLEKMTYQKANELEKLLDEINTFINNMIESFNYSGTFYSGESEGLL